MLTPDCTLCCVLQAHHCRSMVPCQDSPSVKHTYYAQVTHTHTHLLGSMSADSDVTVTGVACVLSQVSVPKDLVAVMSAVRDGQDADPKDSSRVVYRFRQPVSRLFTSSLMMSQIRSCFFNESLDL